MFSLVGMFWLGFFVTGSCRARAFDCDVTREDAWVLLFQHSDDRTAVTYWICPFVTCLGKEKELAYLSKCARYWVDDGGYRLVAREVETTFLSDCLRKGVDEVVLKANRTGSGAGSLPRFLYLTGNPQSGTLNPTLRISDESIWSRREGRWDLKDRSIAPIAYAPEKVMFFPGRILTNFTSCQGYRLAELARLADQEMNRRVADLKADLASDKAKLAAQFASDNAKMAKQQSERRGKELKAAREKWERSFVMDDREIDSRVVQAMKAARLNAAIDGADPDKAEESARRETRELLYKRRSEVLAQKQIILERAKRLLVESGGNLDTAREALTQRMMSDALQKGFETGLFEVVQVFEQALQYCVVEQGL
jgi:hypothetical protein